MPGTLTDSSAAPITSIPSVPSIPAAPGRLQPLRRWGARLALQLFPASCALCGAAGARLCDDCATDLDADRAHCCPQCALPLPPTAAVATRCGQCLATPPAFDQSLTAARYTPPFDQLIIALKYHADLAQAPLLADLLAERLRNALPVTEHPDLLLAVPLSSGRLAERGYNQAGEIARALGKRLGIAVHEPVLRIRHTAAQAQLPHAARQRNVRGAFAVRDGLRDVLHDRVVGVVDDVMTTGATLSELARVLKAAGARRVVNLVVARTP